MRKKDRDYRERRKRKEKLENGRWLDRLYVERETRRENQGEGERDRRKARRGEREMIRERREKSEVKIRAVQQRPIIRYSVISFNIRSADYSGGVKLVV